MQLQPLIPIFLVLAIAFSWPCFVHIFRAEMDFAFATGPLGMIASSVCISSIGLAVSDNGPLHGMFIAAFGAILAQVKWLPRITPAVPLAVLSLIIYLKLGAGAILGMTHPL